MKTILPPTHTSPETAYVIEDYPYSFRLRCQKRVWIEYKNTLGYRSVFQTSNPRAQGSVSGTPETASLGTPRPVLWNARKNGTYSSIALAMYLSEDSHLHGEGLTEYSTADSSQAFLDEYRAGLSQEAIARTELWIAKKKVYEKAVSEGRVKCYINDQEIASKTA